MKPIALNINDEYKIKIENGNDFKGSIFEEVYDNAAITLCEIVNQSKNGSEYDSYNNIIAFTGERGKGKSSSMISFRNALLNHTDKNKHASFFEAKEFGAIHKLNFAEIDIVDPSLFRGNESLFEIIVAKMFSKFQKLIKKEDNNISDEQRREIIKLFQQVFDNLKIINSDKKEIYNLDSLEALSNLAYSSKLRSCFGELVDKFLKLTEERKSFLIIAIDDFDLNISKAYEMLEDIRHFLIQKKIILLVACKIEQLKDSIINEIVKEYRHKLNLQQKNTVFSTTKVNESNNTFSRNNKKFSADVEMSTEFVFGELALKAEKYIEKLIPFNHQIFIPSLSEFCDISFKKYEDSDSVEFSFFEIDDNSKIINKEPSLIFVGNNDSLDNIELNKILDSKNQVLKNKLMIEGELFVEDNIYDCLLKLIYLKSGVFINKTDYRFHSIFPKTLRELNELIKVFSENNELENFRRYILNKGINELPDNLKKVFIELDQQDITLLNSHIINHLGNLKAQFEENNNTPYLNLYKSNNPSLASVGDVIRFMKLFYENVKNTNIYWLNFLDYLSLYHSVRLAQAIKDKPQIILEYYKAGLYSGDYQIFPRNKNVLDLNGNPKRRDWIEFKLERKPGQSINSIFKSLDETNAYWLAFFVQYFGVSDSEEHSYPYFRIIHSGGAGTLNLTFSPFAILTNILFPVEVWNSIFNSEFDSKNIIMKDIINWRNENSEFQLLLMNPMFFNELSLALKYFSENAFKSSSIPNYFETLYVYFTESIRKTIKVIKDKYGYLAINENCFESHPILLHWQRINSNNDDSKRMSELFETFIKGQNVELYKIVNEISESELKLVKDKLRYYKPYFLDKSNDNPAKLTYLIKTFDNNSKIHKDLSKIRYAQGKSILIKKTETYKYLNDIVDGQSS